MIERIISFDLETICNTNNEITNEMIQKYEKSEMDKVLNNKTIKKDSTRNKHIQEIQEQVMLLRSNQPNTIKEKLIKDASLDVLNNNICSIGVTYLYEGKIVNEGKTSKDEKELLDWFIEHLVKFNASIPIEDLILAGHRIREFDIPTLRSAFIRNRYTNLDKLIMFKKFGRDTLLPTSKYSNFVIDTMDIYPVKLDKIGQSLLGESKTLDGSKVYEYFKAGRFDELSTYVAKDSLIPFKLLQVGLI